jgi:hypothetical protein
MIRITVVTTPYEVQFYISAGGNFRMIERMGKDSVKKQRHLIDLLVKSYEQIGFQVDVKRVRASDKLRGKIKNAVKQAIMGRITTNEFDEVKQKYINMMCGGTLEQADNYTR